MPFALSIHELVSSAGTDVAFASIVGLAILVLLYFAQARETATLREQIQEAGQLIQQLEARISQLARQQASAAPAPSRAVPAAIQNATPSVARLPAVAFHGPPAGVAAPPLTAATRVIPAGAPVESVPAREPAVAAVAATPQPVGAATAVPGPRPLGAPEPAGPPPATVAGASNGHSPATPPPFGVAQPPLRPPLRPVAQPLRRPLIPPEPPPRHSRAGRVIAFLLGALIIGGAVAGLVIATSHNGNKQATAGTATSNAPNAVAHVRQSSLPAPASITVAVLNGTNINLLAHKTAVRLAADGYRQGRVSTATDQTRTTTIVQFLPGARAAAIEVAGALKLKPGAVQAIDPSTQAIACPPPTACTATVVVTVGTDMVSQ